MISIALNISFGLIAAALLLNAWRLLAGPTLMDRVLAADTMVVNTIALIIVYGIQQQTTQYFESALLFACLGSLPRWPIVDLCSAVTLLNDVRTVGGLKGNLMINLVDMIVAMLVVTGAVFTFVGSFGLARLGHFMQRLHSPTKATTLGVGGLLWASIVFFYSQQGVFSTNELLITLFLFITAPISAHFMARAYLHQQRDSVRQQTPLPSHVAGWSFDAASDAGNPSPAGPESAAHDSH